MASAYGYLTVANLESFAITDYGSVDASYTDGVVEAVITQAERMINTKCGQSFSGTIPDAIVAATTELSYRMMYNRMVWDGFMDRENPKKRLMPLWDADLEALIENYIDKTLDSEVDLIATYPGRDY